MCVDLAPGTKMSGYLVLVLARYPHSCYFAPGVPGICQFGIGTSSFALTDILNLVFGICQVLKVGKNIF